MGMKHLAITSIMNQTQNKLFHTFRIAATSCCKFIETVLIYGAGYYGQKGDRIETEPGQRSEPFAPRRSCKNNKRKKITKRERSF